MSFAKDWIRLALASGFALAAAGAALADFRYWNPAAAGSAPRRLSETGFYQDLAAGKATAKGVNYFEVNSPAWSDGSHKKRWVILKPGASIGFRELDDYWDYPDSTVFVQEFAFDTVAGDTSTRILWETRFLVLKKERLEPYSSTLRDSWYGFSYRWRADQSDADLVPDEGQRAALRHWPQGRGKPSALKKWVFPARDACNHCHQTGGNEGLHGRSVLGFFTAQLNRASATAKGRNQLEDFFDRGLLKGTRPADYARTVRWHGLDSQDPQATLERKSRAYIAANCSGCHGYRGIQLGATFGVDLDFDYHTGKPAMKLEYGAVSWSYGLDTVPPVPRNDIEQKYWGVSLLTPSVPQKSVILFRQKARNTIPPDHLDPDRRVAAYDPDRNQMPPLGSFEVNEAAVKVMEEWILSLGFPPLPVAAPKAQAPGAPHLRGGTLFIPPDLLKGGTPVVLRDLQGRAAALARRGPGEFALETSAPKGVYLLHIGSEPFRVYHW